MALPLTAIRELSYEDYALIPDDGRRHEVLGGHHVVSPALRTRHQRLVGDLAAKLRQHVRRHALGQVFVAPFDVLLSAHDIVQPDLLFVSDARLAIVNDANCAGAPDLVVEVLSASTRRRDLVDKRLLYERARVAEYWAVDPDVDSVLVFRLDAEGRYARTERRAEAGDALESPLVPGFTLPLADLFVG